jgi:hypothetical protein
MKISDIVESTQIQEQETEPSSLGDITQRYSNNPELVDYIRKAHTHTKVKTWAQAETLGFSEYSKDQLKKMQAQRAKTEPKAADKLKPKDTVARRVSQFGTVGTDAASQAKGKIAQAWQRGGRWSRALGVPSPKKS